MGLCTCAHCSPRAQMTVLLPNRLYSLLPIVMSGEGAQPPGAMCTAMPQTIVIVIVTTCTDIPQTIVIRCSRVDVYKFGPSYE